MAGPAGDLPIAGPAVGNPPHLPSSGSKERVSLPEELIAILDALIVIGRPRLVEISGGRRDTCISAASFGVEVLKAFGISAQPLPVRVLVTTADVWEETLRGGALPATGYSLGIGFGDPMPGCYGGHLVVLVEKTALLDLTLDQADRPSRGIPLRPEWFGPLDQDFVSGVETTEGFGRIDPPIRIGYIRMPVDDPEATRWRTSPDWARRGELKPVIGTVIRKIRASLASCTEDQTEQEALGRSREGHGTESSSTVRVRPWASFGTF
jgi:hypothetical protein